MLKNEQSSSYLALCAFTAQMIAHLEYTEISDPLYIVQMLLQPMIDSQGHAILDALLKIIHGSDEYDDDEEDDVERLLGCKRVNNEDAQVLCKRLFADDKFECLVQQGAAIVLLLRLKSFLKDLYGITETKIFSYRKDSTAFIKEKCSCSNRRLVFNHNLPLLTGSASACNTHQVSSLKQYYEFRRLLRSEYGSEDIIHGMEAGDVVFDE